MDSAQYLDKVVLGEYRTLACIGSGTFGTVYKAKHIRTNVNVAIKISNVKRSILLFRKEYELYNMQRKSDESAPKAYLIGMVGGKPALVMDLLGSSLQTVFNSAGGKIPLSMVRILAVRMIRSIELFHRSTGHVHRDIKPDNFVMEPTRSEVHLIDFGLAKPFWNRNTNKHVAPARKKCAPVGTMRYASLNTHQGLQQSRRDDMEALAYTLVYFLRGSLPWQGLKIISRTERMKVVAEKKLSTNIGEVCEGLPDEFMLFLSNCRQLEYAEQPDYDAFQRLISGSHQPIAHDTAL